MERRRLFVTAAVTSTALAVLAHPSRAWRFSLAAIRSHAINPDEGRRRARGLSASCHFPSLLVTPAATAPRDSAKPDSLLNAARLE